MKPAVNWEKLKKFYLLVRMMCGSSNDQRKRFTLPYIEGVVTKVDVENQRIDVDIPEGLIDDEN